MEDFKPAIVVELISFISSWSLLIWMDKLLVISGWGAVERGGREDPRVTLLYRRLCWARASAIVMFCVTDILMIAFIVSNDGQVSLSEVCEGLLQFTHLVEQGISGG
jgi:hypothetical protein